ALPLLLLLLFFYSTSTSAALPGAQKKGETRAAEQSTAAPHTTPIPARAPRRTRSEPSRRRRSGNARSSPGRPGRMRPGGSMKPQQAALLQAVLDDPDDAAARLVFADWCEEDGQADRAEFIRIQIERARLAPLDARHAELAPREQALLEAHAT